MTIAGALTPSLTGDATAIAAKLDQYTQAEEDRAKAPTRTKDLNLLHFNIRTLNDETKMEKTGKQLASTYTHIATFPESKLKTTETYVKHGYIISSSAAAPKSVKGPIAGAAPHGSAPVSHLRKLTGKTNTCSCKMSLFWSLTLAD